jgi:hypothetical protein
MKQMWKVVFASSFLPVRDSVSNTGHIFLTKITRHMWKSEHICGILLHPNVTEKNSSENSRRYRIWAWLQTNFLMSIERLGLTMHNIKENIQNFAVTVEFYWHIYEISNTQTTQSDRLFLHEIFGILHLHFLFVIFYTNCLEIEIAQSI